MYQKCWFVRHPLALAEFLGGSVSCCRLLQFRSHLVAFPRHFSLVFPFSVIWSRSDVIGLFSINAVSFSPNVVLRAPLFSPNSVWKRAMLSVLAVYVLSSLQLGEGRRGRCWRYRPG